jgi:hypothetical protein
LHDVLERLYLRIRNGGAEVCGVHIIELSLAIYSNGKRVLSPG